MSTASESRDTPLILASGSRYRAALLARLGLPFLQQSSDVDESRQAGESPGNLAMRLARAKAAAVAGDHPGAWVIGSDQVAVRDEEILGKPGNRDRAVEQLLASSGREVEFLTAAVLLGGPDGVERSHLDITTVRFRPLRRETVKRYVERDQPLDCAGGFKAESLGIVLFDEIRSTDPTALTGLPLIWLAAELTAAGVTIL